MKKKKLMFNFIKDGKTYPVVGIESGFDRDFNHPLAKIYVDAPANVAKEYYKTKPKKLQKFMPDPVVRYWRKEGLLEEKS